MELGTIRSQGTLVLSCTINLGGGGRGSANLALRSVHWWRGKHLAVDHRAIYSHIDPTVDLRSQITSQAHAYHVGRRHSECNAQNLYKKKNFNNNKINIWRNKIVNYDIATYAWAMVVEDWILKTKNYFRKEVIEKFSSTKWLCISLNDAS
jgi:hypothetical protein